MPENDHNTRIRLLEETRVTREEGDGFWANRNVQVIVYSMVGLILAAVITALVGLVITR